MIDYIKNHVHNRASTLTNLSYILLGYLALSREPIMGALLILVGIASAGFHWTRSDCWHKADIVAIFYIFSVLSAWHWLGNQGILLGFCVGAVLHYHFTRSTSQHIIGVLGGLTLIPFWINNGWYETAYVLMWFMIAFACGRLAVYFEPDEDGQVYDWLHSWWHIFSAIGIYYLII